MRDKAPKVAPEPHRGNGLVVTDEMVEEYRAVKNHFITLKHVEHTYGNGYGVEPHGYKLTALIAVVELPHQCPKCDNLYGTYEYRAGDATCSPAFEETYCNRCDTQISEKRYPP